MIATASATAVIPTTTVHTGSGAEYDALQETAYLLRSPANARRLLEGYAQAKAGQVGEHELDRRP